MSRLIMELEVRGKTQARDQVLEEMQVSENDVDISFEKKGGLFSFGKSQPVQAQVFLKNEDLPVENIARGVALTMIRKMGYDATIVSVEDVDGKAYIRLESPDSGKIIGKRGKTLEALQFITDLISNRFSRESRKVILDIEGYRTRRKESLERLAGNIAKKVVESSRSRLLEPMNPFERRIIHLALQEHEEVFTRSEGVGVFKKVRIALLPEGMNKQQFLDSEADIEAELRAQAEAGEIDPNPRFDDRPEPGNER